MCLILLALGAHARYPLVIAANRDESYDRPAAPLSFWEDEPDIAGGRDLEAGGTWLGITRKGRWAALTNFRLAGSYRSGAPSRGKLVAEYLSGVMEPRSYLEHVAKQAGAYNGFSLLVGVGADVYCLSNRGGQAERLGHGAHGLSNHLLNTPWPKVARGRQLLQSLPDLTAAELASVLLQALQNRSAPPDEELPDSGVGLERERILAAPFIVSPSYGTRATTVILLDRSGHVAVVEQSFGPLGIPLGSVSLEFAVTFAPASADAERTS